MSRSDLRVLHVTNEMDDSFGGPAQSIPSLAAALRAVSVQSSIWYVSKRHHSHNALIDRERLETRAFRAVGPASLGFSPRLLPALRAAMRERAFDVVHAHHAWYSATSVAAHAATRARIPYVMSPHSDLYLASLARRSGKKRLALWTYAGPGIRLANCVVATDARERDEFWKAGFHNPVAVIPHGLDPAFGDDVRAARRSSPTTPRIALFLSRVHPRKRVLELVRAFAGIADRFPEWRLAIAGPLDDPPYAARIRDCVATHRLGERVTLLGMVRGGERVKAFASAELFVLPTLFENFGMAIGEALSSALPVITTDGTPWQEIADHGAGWILPAGNDEALESELATAFALPPDRLAAMGMVGARLAFRHTWPASAESHRALYDHLLGRAGPPAVLFTAPGR